MNIPMQRVYYVLFVVTIYESFQDALARDPELIKAHIARTKELHAGGTVLMAGAFLDKRDELLSTMAVLTTREAAEEYAKGDPFIERGLVRTWYIREWANLFA